MFVQVVHPSEFTFDLYAYFADAINSFGNWASLSSAFFSCLSYPHSFFTNIDFSYAAFKILSNTITTSLLLYIPLISFSGAWTFSQILRNIVCFLWWCWNLTLDIFVGVSGSLIKISVIVPVFAEFSSSYQLCMSSSILPLFIALKLQIGLCF